MLAALLATMADAGWGGSSGGFPSHVVRIFVQGGPGSPGDTRARLLGGHLSQQWAQPVVIENRPSAGGQLALEVLRQAPPDGHSLAYAGQALFTVAPHVRKLPFDPLKDFVAVTQTSVSPLILAVNPHQPVNTVSDLVAYAKRNPGKLNAATPGLATTQHLALELFNRTAGAAIAGVPYKDGAGQMVVDLASGKTDLMFDVFLSIGSYIRNGRLRALAVTGPSRLPLLPDVPTFSEAGLPAVDSVMLWAGFFCRSGTPPRIIDEIHQAVTAVLERPDVRTVIAETGATVAARGPHEFSSFVAAEHARYGALIREVGIKFD
jgi:tripartite-type tricarboxylate transporter receptor subunit TctC